MSTVMEDTINTKSNCGTRQGGVRPRRKPERLDVVFTQEGLTKARITERRKPTITMDNQHEFPFLRSSVASPITNQSIYDNIPMTRDGISTRGYDLLSSRGMPRTQTTNGVPLSTIQQSDF